MIHFVSQIFTFEGREHKCGKESKECQVQITMPICGNAVEDVIVERCILHELQYLWKQGIKTHCSCCGHGLPYNAFITVDKSCKDEMEKLGYESSPDMLEVCNNCDVGIMYVPRSVLTEEAYDKG